MHRKHTLAILFTLFVASATRAGDPKEKPDPSADPNTWPKEFTNSAGLKFVRIDGGKYIRGTGEKAPQTRQEWLDRDWDESPAHPVSVETFALATTEVTNAQYEQFDPEHEKLRGLGGVSKADDAPVTHVAWDQAVAFCKWLNKKEKTELTRNHYRLPYEAEWEYACRAGTTTPFFTGEKITPEQANFGFAADGKKRITTVPVASYPANKWGLFDIVGNVAEWCMDSYAPYSDGTSDYLQAQEKDVRVVRGWSYLPVSHPSGVTRYCRSANRSALLPDDANRATGFRVAFGRLRMLPAGRWPTTAIAENVKQTPAPLEVPDPKTPYFIDYRKAKKLPGVPKDSWGPIFSQHNHFTAVTVCPNGDVLFAWYTTVSEEGRECAQAATRLRAGTDQWDTPDTFLTVGDCNTHAPVLLRDGNVIHHFFTQSLAGWDDAADCMRTSKDNGATWSPSRIILRREDPLRMSQPCSAYVSKTGKLVLAVDGDFGHRDERVMVSADQGKTWTVGKGDMRKAAGGKYVIHPAIVERKDGSILTFLRGQHPMPALASKDDGATWDPVETPFPGISVGQKAIALRLASGAMLLCSFDNKKEVVGGGTFAALSDDDGKTWPVIRKVEGVGGYMSAAQAPNGVIYLVGSNVACVAFNEAWLREKK